MKVLARINRTTDAGNLAPRTGLYTQLRKTPFTSSAVTGTEIDTGLYEFDVTGTNLTAYLKCYVSTDNSTFTEYESWGGTDGIRVINPAIEVVDADYTIATNQLIELNANNITLNADVGLSFTATSGNIVFQDEVGEKFLTTNFGTPTALENVPTQIQTVTLTINGQEYKLIIKP